MNCLDSEEVLYYLFSENKDADQFCVTTKLICVFVFAFAKSRFSHDAAHIVKQGFTGVYIFSYFCFKT